MLDLKMTMCYTGINKQTKKQKRCKMTLEKNLEYYSDYFVALIWADVENSPDVENGDDISIYDIDENSLKEQIEQLDAFFLKADPILENTDYDHGQACHDFYFTRCGHGVGFWENDHCNEEQGKALTEIAEQFGTLYLYTDNDKLFITKG